MYGQFHGVVFQVLNERINKSVTENETFETMIWLTLAQRASCETRRNQQRKHPHPVKENHSTFSNNKKNTRIRETHPLVKQDKERRYTPLHICQPGGGRQGRSKAPCRLVAGEGHHSHHPGAP